MSVCMYVCMHRTLASSSPTPYFAHRDQLDTSNKEGRLRLRRQNKKALVQPQ